MTNASLPITYIPMNRAIFILGMHRSGTSALTNVVSQLGASLSDQLMAASTDNEKGFFEHEGVVIAHETLLSALHQRWQDFLPLPQDWTTTDAATDARKAIDNFIEQDFASTPFWALKDPRISRLLPLWLPLLAQRDIQPMALVAWRNPLEVAASLNRRNNMPESNALLCWLAYTIESLRHAQSMPFAIISYDALMDNWQPTMREAATQLAIEWPTSLNKAAPAINSFLSPELRHHRNPLQFNDSPIHQLVKQCISTLQHFSTESFAALEADWKLYCDSVMPATLYASQQAADISTQHQQITQQHHDLQHAVDDLTQKLTSLQRDHEALWERLAKTEEAHKDAMVREQMAMHALKEINQELDTVYASTSWRITSPLRKMNARLQHLSTQAKEDSHD